MNGITGDGSLLVVDIFIKTTYINNMSKGDK
jgi:hypothetical protein